MVRAYLQHMDDQLLTLCSHKLRNKFLDFSMPVITRLNDYGMIFILLSLLSIGIGYRTDVAFHVLMALTVGLILGEGLLKHLIKRARPCFSGSTEKPLIKIPRTSSFPSGHTTSSFAVFYVLWYSNSSLRFVALLLAILIAFSRIYLYVHYPSDVLAGLLLGLLSGQIIVMLSGNSYSIDIVENIFSQLGRLMG